MFSPAQTALLVTLFLLQGAFSPATAQVYPFNFDPKPARGFMPTSDQLSTPFDSIDAVNGKLHLQIPLASLPPGRAGSGFDLDLVYDSHLYDMNVSSSTFQTLSPAFTTGGWTYNFKNYKLQGEERPVSECQTVFDYSYFRLRVGLPDGSLHILHRRGEPFADDGFYKFNPGGQPVWCGGSQGTVTGWLTYYTTDGSYLKLEIFADGTPDWWNKNWHLYSPSGRRVVGRGDQVEQLYDANDNGILFLNACVDAPVCDMPFTRISAESDPPDTVRAIQVDFNTTGAVFETDPEMEDRVTAPGPNGPLTWTINWQAITIGGDGSNRFYQCSPSPPDCPLDIRHWVIKYIQLPLSPAVPASQTPPVWNSYAFGYSDNSDPGYGELDQVRIPSGALYNYRYTLEGGPIDDTESIAHFNAVSRKTITHDGVTGLQWTYTFADTSSTTVNPDGGSISHSFADKRNIQNWDRGLVYQISEPNGSVRKRVWSRNKVWASEQASVDPNNPFIQKETVTVGNASGQPAETAVTDYTLDKNGNLLQRTEYDWVAYNSGGVEAGVIPRRVTNRTYHVPVPAAPIITDDPLAYWQPHSAIFWSIPTSARRLDAVRFHEVSDGTAVKAATEFGYDSPYTKGNVTAEKRWDSDKAGPPGPGQFSTQNSYVLTRSYSASGNLEDIFEPEVRTHITYDAAGYYPTRIDSAYQTTAQRSWTYSWDSGAGVLNSKTDLDNNITTSFTYDPIGRRLTVTEAGLRRAATTYDDPNRKVIFKRDLDTLGDGKLQTITHYDELGRVRLSRTSDGAPLSTSGETDGIKMKTAYLAATNRIVRSTPYRSTSDATMEWICTQSDQLGRVTASAMFKGSSEPTDCESTVNRTGITRTVYDAAWITNTDPASKVRTQRRDALGRMIQVVEDPSGLNYSTAYTYDPLDNLATVTQGPQTRSFVYSSLSRLRAATNPESGTIQYAYYTSGNFEGELQARTDARGVVASYTYDPLHRMLTRTYANDPASTPAVTYDYHLAGSASAPHIGNLKSVTSSAATAVYDSYNVLGQLTASTHTINGNPNTYTFGYTYWLHDTLKTMQYPSGKLMNYSADDAGRTSRAYTVGRTYADLTVTANPYTPDGRIAKMKLGNDLWETRDYQVPGIPTRFKLGTSVDLNDKLELEYNYSGTDNNGNLLSHVVRQPGVDNVWTQMFGTAAYDGVNRLISASETKPGGTPWNQTFGYDPYGNRWVASSSGLAIGDTHEPTASSNFSIATNRLNVAGSTYDAAGNQTLYTPYTLDYDAESRNTGVTSAGSGTGSSLYDGDGRRVKKMWTPSGGSATATYYIYSALGQLAAEYSDQTPATAGTSWLHTDMLGSVRMVTGEKLPTGSAPVLECYDYVPFGRLLTSPDNARNTGCYPANPITFTSRVPQKFTGKERDVETGLDFFGARYYSGAQGRFTSPDPSKLSAFIDNPQSWNQYTYAYNEPFQFVDRNGQWPTKLHNQIIDAAFPNLTPAQREILKDVSRDQDSLLGGGQSPALSFQHAMRATGQSVAEAQAAYSAFVSDHLNRATQAQINFWAQGNRGLSNVALKQFAMALHAILDSTSPAHMGFQEWKLRPFQAGAHAALESTMMPWEQNKGTKAAIESFDKTFSPQLFSPFDLLELLSKQGSNGNGSTGRRQTGTNVTVCITYSGGPRECQ